MLRASFIEQIILSLLTQDSPKRSPASPAFIVAGILALAGAGFLIVAGYEWLSVNYDEQTARVGAGLLSLVLALVIATCAYAVHVYKLRKMQAYYHVVKNNLESAIHAVTDELEEPIRENPKTAVLMAGVAGFVAAEKLLH